MTMINTSVKVVDTLLKLCYIIITNTQTHRIDYGSYKALLNQQLTVEKTTDAEKRLVVLLSSSIQH